VKGDSETSEQETSCEDDRNAYGTSGETFEAGATRTGATRPVWETIGEGVGVFLPISLDCAQPLAAFVPAFVLRG